MKQIVRVKSDIDFVDLCQILKETRMDFPTLDNWTIDIRFERIDPFAQVVMREQRWNRRVRKSATILINSRFIKSWTRMAYKGLIAHELMHCELWEKRIPSSEEIIAQRLLTKGYFLSFNAMMFCICREYCGGTLVRTIGGVDCRARCPFR